MTVVHFNIEQWAAWAPGLDSKENWLQWAKSDALPENNDAQPDASFIPAIQRRRFSRLTKMALNVAHQCQQDNPPMLSIFGSRHGELTRTRKLLDEVIEKQPLSPIGFSMSVHNTASGLNSILTGNKRPSTSIAAGMTTLEQCFIEAYCWLKQGHQKVLVVYADEPTPSDYQPYMEHTEVPVAAAFVVSLENPEMTLEVKAHDHGLPKEMPILSFLRFLTLEQESYSLCAEHQQWHWHKGSPDNINE